MNYRLVSALLKSNWAIDPQFAINSMSWVNDLLKGNIEIESTDSEKYKPYAATKPEASDRFVFRSIDEAEKGSVAVIPVMGSLMKQDQLCGPMGMATLGEIVKRADNNPNIEGMVLHIDSPGGTVDGTEVFAETVKNAKKPVVTYVDGLMASAALWIGSGADEVFASTKNDEIGSVGVVMQMADFQPLYEEMGVVFHTITADQSNEKVKMYKDIRNGNYKEFKEEFLNPMAQTFIDAIKENRPDVQQKHLTGKVFLASKVMGVYVDQIGSFEDVIDRVYQLADEQKQNNNQTQSQSQTMEFKNIIAVLSIASLEADKDGYVQLNQEQLQEIDQALGRTNQAETERDNLQQEVTQLKQDKETLQSEKDNLQGQIKQLQKEPGADHTDVPRDTDASDQDAESDDVLSNEDHELYNKYIKQE